MKTSFILTVVALLFIVSSLNAKSLVDDDDSDMELTDMKARAFLRSMGDDGSDDSASLDTRDFGKRNCVKCKFGISPCCAPSICRKKHFRPDECINIKQGK